MIYLDNASTTKINIDVLKEMMPYFNELFFNASSVHNLSINLKHEIEKSRILCAELINSNPSEIIFTSGATESINYALKGFMEENFDKGNHIITSKTEHKAVLKTCEYLETKGIQVTYLDVDSSGLINLEELENCITSETSLIAIMFANNETGVIQDIKSIGKIAKQNNVVFFCDATQAIGKIEIDVNELNIDILSMSAHKINGPKGIGFLYKKNSISLTPLLHGGSQENENRGGTYNTPLIVGLGKACEIAKKQISEATFHFNSLHKSIINHLKKSSRIQIIGNEDQRVNNIYNLKIKDFNASIFIESSKDIIVSNGSACTSRIVEGSHVLKAMGLSDEECNQCLRISFDILTSLEEINQFFKKLY